MIHYNLNPEEILFIKLIFIYKDHNRELLDIFLKQGNYTDVKKTIKSLEEKKILIKNQDPDIEKINIENLEFNKNFLKNYLKYSLDLGMELIEHYPKHIYIDNKKCCLINPGQKYDSFEQFCYEYGRAIGFNEQTHKEIIDLLDKHEDYEMDLIHYGICDFIIGRKWTFLKDEIDNGFDYTNRYVLN